ncbi:MAG: T9SS C-terminal target domain-containing protein, partial [Flavobacteriia bacterium]|nr:T9SS C-terminal target domain-containing protein [Flavobacteriia bacterium]
GKSSQTLQITEGSIQVGIQPNPFQSNPTVVHNLPSDKAYTFELYDAAGRKLQEYISPLSPFTIETQGMSQGSYWLKCIFEGEKLNLLMINLN